jgi:hypothetical protein
MENVESKIRKLKPEQKKEVNDFIDFLLNRKISKKKKKPSFEWFGCLKEYRDTFTSIELQKKSLEWRD